MSKYEEEELSAWDVAYSQALARVMAAYGYSGIDFFDLDEDAQDEIEQAVLEEVGPKPVDDD